MKIWIYYNFVEGPYGGGNQFLKALCKELASTNNLLEPKNISDLDQLDAIVFNSHHTELPNNIGLTLKEIKEKYKNITFVHRIDGPIQCVRGINDGTDQRIFDLNNELADGTVFQSNWSLNKTQALGFKYKNPYIVIKNSSDPSLFYKKERTNLSGQQKIKLAASSWSNNIKKGFWFYAQLDQKLDFNKYEMFFVGRSPIKFNNIQHVEPLPSKELGDFLRNCDIMINCSVDDPASNSLTEGILSGLAVVAIDSGGHREIVGNKGELFSNLGELLNKIETVSSNIEQYDSKQTIIPSIKDVGQQYIEFIRGI